MIEPDTFGCLFHTFDHLQLHIVLRTDDSGKPYVCKFSSELTKIHQGIRNEQYKAEGGRMYETTYAIISQLSICQPSSERGDFCLKVFFQTK
jgi:hypothetical protein